MIHLEHSLEEFRSEWFGQCTHLKISFGAHQASYFGIRNSDKLPTIKYYFGRFMQIVGSTILLTVISQVLIDSQHFMWVTDSNILFWMIHTRRLLENLILGTSGELSALSSYPEQFIWRIFSFWAGASCDLRARKSRFESFIQGISYFRHFMKITSSEILLWVI